jgi:hypothetical protein
MVKATQQGPWNIKKTAARLRLPLQLLLSLGSIVEAPPPVFQTPLDRLVDSP